MSDTHRHPPVACPACGYVADAASVVPGHKDATPAAGDFSVCAECGAVRQFTAALGLRVPTPQEIKELDQDLRWLLGAAQRAIREYHRERRRRL